MAFGFDSRSMQYARLAEALSYDRLECDDLSVAYVNAVAPPGPVYEEVMRARRAGMMFFDHLGLPELRRALAEELTRRLGIELTEREILLIDGGTSDALHGILRVSRGRAVLTFAPHWFGYAPTCEEAGIKRMISEFMHPEELQVNPERIPEHCMKKGVRTVLVNDVVNPTGTAMTRASARAVGEALLALPEPPVCVQDHHYCFNIFPGATTGCVAAETPELWRTGQLLGIGSFRLGFSLDAGNIAFVYGKPKVLEMISVALRRGGYSHDPPNQIGALQCFSDAGWEVNREIIDCTLKNLALLRGFLAKQPYMQLIGSPEGGVTAFVDVEDLIAAKPTLGRFTLRSADDLVDMLTMAARVYVFEGTMFTWRESNAIRISLVGLSPTEFAAALDRIERTLKCLSYPHH